MIYLDYAAATPVRREVLRAMRPFEKKYFANPSSTHKFGKAVSQKIEKEREYFSTVLYDRSISDSVSGNVIFISSGTQSINLALRGLLKKGDHLITSSIEHKAVLETAKYLESQGIKVTYLPVTSLGLVKISDLRKAITKKTKLISIQYANSEIGVIQNIEAIALNARRRKVLFHTDACQAGFLPSPSADLITLNAGKMYGPKGIALLYIGKDVKLDPLMFGGEQESGLNPGTQNVAGIIGFSKALSLIKSSDKENARIRNLRYYFTNRILKEIEDTQLNGPRCRGLPGIVNISFLSVENDILINHLSEQGIYVSAGSACNSKEMQHSYVLQALGLSEEGIKSAIRFSLGRKTTKRELDKVVVVLKKIVKDLRKI